MKYAKNRKSAVIHTSLILQICSAIITYCPVAIVQHNMQLKRSNYEVLQILNGSRNDSQKLKKEVIQQGEKRRTDPAVNEQPSGSTYGM